jgi:phosphate transport system permease protein
MNNLIFIFLLLSILSAAYFYGRRYALVSVNHNRQELHSLPGYYGLFVVLWFVLPAAFAFAVWYLLEPILIDRMLFEAISSSAQNQSDILLNEIRNLAFNSFAMKAASPEKALLVERYLELRALGFNIQTALIMGCGAIGLILARRALAPQLRARQAVERIVIWLLILCSAIAIFTTIGIVLSRGFK